MSLTRIGTRSVATSPRSASVAEVVRLMDERNVGSVVIVDGARPVGIVTDRDVVLRVVRRGLDPREVRVEEVMTSELACVTEEVAPIQAAGVMRERQVRRLPIVDAKGALVGLLSLDDLLYQFGREVGELADAIAPFPVVHLGG
jgi:CBS domain-containing protein